MPLTTASSSKLIRSRRPRASSSSEATRKCRAWCGPSGATIWRPTSTGSAPTDGPAGCSSPKVTSRKSKALWPFCRKPIRSKDSTITSSASRRSTTDAIPGLSVSLPANSFYLFFHHLLLSFFERILGTPFPVPLPFQLADSLQFGASLHRLLYFKFLHFSPLWTATDSGVADDVHGERETDSRWNWIRRTTAVRLRRRLGFRLRFQVRYERHANCIQVYMRSILRDMHKAVCGHKGLCKEMMPVDGSELLQYLRKVEFVGNHCAGFPYFLLINIVCWWWIASFSTLQGSVAIVSSSTTMETVLPDTTSFISNKLRQVDIDGSASASTTRANWSSTWTVFIDSALYMYVKLFSVWWSSSIILSTNHMNYIGKMELLVGLLLPVYIARNLVFGDETKRVSRQRRIKSIGAGIFVMVLLLEGPSS